MANGKQRKKKWRQKAKRRRRNYRSAPEEQPPVAVSNDLKRRVGELCGERLLERVVAAFPGGNLPGTPEEFHALEKSLLETVRTEVVGNLLVEVMREAHGDDEFVRWCMAAAARREELRSHGDVEVHVRAAGGGETRLMTPYMAPPPPQGKPGAKRAPGRRGKGGAGLYPVLAVLGLVARTSPYVASAAAKAATRGGSFEEAKEVLGEQGIDLHADTVRTIMAHVADAGLADREEGAPIDTTFLAGKRVVIAPDGGRMRLRQEKSGRRRKSGYHGYDTPWREPKLFTAYVIDEKGKQVPDKLPIYEGTFAPWMDSVEILAKTLHRYGIEQAAEIIIAADGSDNIWDQVERLVRLLGVDPARVTLVVDFCHAVAHLNNAAKLSISFETDQQRRQWVKKQRGRLKRGQVERVLFDMAALPTDSDEAAENLCTECDYFRNRKERMRYGEFRRRGIPIGTGAIESAVRRVVNLRLKAPGSFWTPENAERMLYLRCRLKAGRWQEVEDALHRAALRPKRSAEPAILAKVAATAEKAAKTAKTRAKAKEAKAA